MKTPIEHAAEIIERYRKPYSGIDIGNVFYSATEYQRAYKVILDKYAKLSLSYDKIKDDYVLACEKLHEIRVYSNPSKTRHVWAQRIVGIITGGNK